MDDQAPVPTTRRRVLLGLALSSVLAPWGAQAQTTATPAAASAPHRSPFRGQRESARAQQFYASRWGVDKLVVSYTNSGNLIRFSYRVSDPVLAKPLGEKRNAPVLYAPRARAVLQVPVMDKVGELRQAVPPEAGKEYWMVFSNKGNLVRPGDRVNVSIGAFHAEGLMVE